MHDRERLTIAPATPADVPTILAFVHELAEFERLAHEVVATEEVLSESLFGARPAAEAVIARFDGEPAGHAIFFHNFSTFHGRAGMYLEDLYVRPQMRGHGIGSALLAHLAGIAQARGCPRLEWSVLKWNAGAIALYEQLGAEPMSDWTVYRLSGAALERLARKAQ